MKVYILAHCRNPKLFGATRMVFDTIRVGFPTAEITVLMGLGGRAEHFQEIFDLARKAGGTCYPSDLSHTAFIKRIIRLEKEPFYFCDTDMMFHDSIEQFSFGCHLAGRFVPKFYNEFSKSITMPRLHTSLLYVNPPALKSAVQAYHAQFPVSKYCPAPDLFATLHIPVSGERDYFYDDSAMLYAAVGGQAFTEPVLDCYDHLHCGTISDEVAPHLTRARNLTEINLHLINNPSQMKGIWRNQEKYYAHFAIKD